MSKRVNLRARYRSHTGPLRTLVWTEPGERKHGIKEAGQTRSLKKMDLLQSLKKEHRDVNT